MYIVVLEAGYLSVLCLFVCASRVYFVGSGFPSFLLFPCNYLSYVVCYMYTCVFMYMCSTVRPIVWTNRALHICDVIRIPTMAPP